MPSEKEYARGAATAVLAVAGCLRYSGRGGMLAPMRSNLWMWIAGCALLARAQVPENLLLDGVPEIPEAVRLSAGPYLEFRTATFQDWHPQERRVLLATRFADATQLHEVKFPGGARRQLTFLPEPVAGGSYRPVTGDSVVLSQDRGGGEFYQLYRLPQGAAQVELLTDGLSRNQGALWSKSGRHLAYTSTRRNGRDTDVYVMDPANRGTDRRVKELTGGGWSVADWSADELQLLLVEMVSINEGYLHVLDVGSGAMRLVTPRTEGTVARAGGRFLKGGRAVVTVSDQGSEFRRLVRVDLETGAEAALTPDARWDVTAYDLAPDGVRVAFVTNEEGYSVLHLVDALKGRGLAVPRLPEGVVTDLTWHPREQLLGLTLSSARSPGDVYGVDLRRSRVERWTESETGGLDPSRFAEPELVRVRSFDGRMISGFLYRPDAAKFPGRRPVLVSIHGGPESQARPLFQARNNYYLNELGVALLVPNVRGSSGYGKTFLTLDNGFKREDSVKDIGAFLDWIGSAPGLDPARVAVIGGSYGGYMVLASLVHYSDRLRCGVDVVGISNFLTFLKNTQDYRRDLRRVEYGDDRDPEMREFLGRISPLSQVEKIRRPLLVVQGKNDPRVPASESEQMVQAIRAAGGDVWYLMAKDEGHGFAKKRNADFQFLVTVMFLKRHLLP